MNTEMAHQNELQQPLVGAKPSPFSPRLKSAILAALFGIEISQGRFRENQDLWGGYFAYYRDECDVAMSAGRLHSVVKTHQDIARLVNLLQSPNNTRESIKIGEKERLKTVDENIHDEVIYIAIDLAARLGFMILVGEIQAPSTSSASPSSADVQTSPQLSSGPAVHIVRGGERLLPWLDGRLDALLAGEFSQTGVLEKEHVKLEKLFNARSLERIAGLQIIWTRNLASHLRVQNEDQAVSIFHFASFLNSQKEGNIYPPGFIDETIQTLALLFPQFDDDCNVWFKKRAKQESLDTDVTKCGQLAAEDRQIENFHFWRDRLIILKQVFDEAEPRGLKRWWRDRRKPVQWYNFWLAVALIVGLTFFFGVVQSVEGAMQVYKAYHPS